MELILNWLWQGGIVAAATAGVLRVISPTRALARYCAAWAGCVAVLALPLIPLVSTAASPAASDASTVVPILSMPDRWWTSPAVVLGAWALWVAVQAVRTILAAVAVRRAKHGCRAFPSRLETRLTHWRRLRVTGRRAPLVLSDQVPAAAVLGGAPPLIAVAPPLLFHLSEADLDRVVVHEWAHVQRRDDVAQAAQLLVRIVAGWHPAIWWLERQLHLEREVACDDIVVAVTGSAKDYATCLTTLASLPIGAGRALPVIAAVSRSGLRHRIIRILAARRTVAPSWRVTAMIGALSVGGIAFGVGNLRVVHTALSMPDVPAAVIAHATRVMAMPNPMAPQVIPDRLAADPSTPMRVETSGRTESATDGRAPARVSAAPPGTTPAAETSMVDGTAAPFASQPVAPVTLAVVLATAPLGPPTVPVSVPASSSTASSDPPTADARAMWDVAAAAGKAVGRRSENAAAAAAGFFTRFGRTVAGSF